MKMIRLTLVQTLMLAMLSCTINAIAILDYGVHGIQGRRWSMEDAHQTLYKDVSGNFHKPEYDGSTVVDDTSINDIPHGLDGYFGVFDGHRGPQAAECAAQQLHVNLSSKIEKTGEFSDEAITDAFIQTDDEICGQEDHESGTTAVVALVTNEGELIVANAGDSRAVACKNGKAVPLSEDHKPSGETARIEAADDQVIFGRVRGSLAVSRSLGDREFKYQKGNEGEREKYVVSPIPDIQRVGAHDTHNVSLLILACDGVWDRMTNEEAVALVLSKLQDGMSAQEAAKELVAKAYENGSLDNITAMVIVFNPPSSVTSTTEDKLEQPGMQEEEKESSAISSNKSQPKSTIKWTLPELSKNTKYIGGILALTTIPLANFYALKDKIRAWWKSHKKSTS